MSAPAAQLTAGGKITATGGELLTVVAAGERGGAGQDDGAGEGLHRSIRWTLDARRWTLPGRARVFRIRRQASSLKRPAYLTSTRAQSPTATMRFWPLSQR